VPRLPPPASVTPLPVPNTAICPPPEMDPISIAGLAGTVVKLLTGCTEFVLFIRDFTTNVKEVDLSLKLSCNEINSLVAILEQIRDILESKAQSTTFHVQSQHSKVEFFEKWATSMKDCDDLLKRWQSRLSAVYGLDNGGPFRKARMQAHLQINARDFEGLHRRVQVHFHNIHMFLSVWNLYVSHAPMLISRETDRLICRVKFHKQRVSMI
jgi:hypothetical protein